jgi:hypothetical protein
MTVQGLTQVLGYVPIFERVRTMPFVQLWSGILAKVHIASNRAETLCGRLVHDGAIETKRPPRDRTRLCKACQKIELEEKPFQEFLK